MKVAIGIITYKRPNSLRKTIDSILKQKFNKIKKPQLTIIIVDNDIDKSAYDSIKNFVKKTNLNIVYEVEKNRGIPYARNRVIKLSINNDYLAFIDDDEFASEFWLDELLFLQISYKYEIVTGPVIPVFDSGVPNWIISGKYFNSNNNSDNSQVKYAATNNVMFKIDVFKKKKVLFDTTLSLSGGSDTLLFKQLILNNYKIYWSNLAIVYEKIPLSRSNFHWLIQREFRKGNSLGFIDYHFKMSIYKTFIRVVKSLFRIVGGLVLFIPLLILDKNKIFNSVLWFVKGLGMLYGIMGFQYNEYKKIHGN